MAIKSILFNAIPIAAVFVLSLTSVESHLQVCDGAKFAGVECSTCNFLTFGQDDLGLGFSYFCPQTSEKEKYCCYGPTRQPFCCDATAYFVTGFLWVAAVLLVIAGVCKFIKCLLA